MNEKKRIARPLLLGLLGVAVLAAFLAKPAWYVYKDVSFYWEERSEAEWTVKRHAEAMGVSYGCWPQSIIGLLEGNPETEDFVLNYPFHDQADPAAAVEGISRETVPLFLQWDESWGYEPYGSSCIAVTGCGPTSLAMAGYYLTGNTEMNPAAIAEFAQKHGYYAPGYGSSWTLISEGAQKLGLQVRELPLVKKKVVTALEEGDPVILALGPGDFTSSGHYIVLTGVEGDAFRVNDPNSRENSARLWTYEELEGQIRNLWRVMEKS